MADPQAHLGPVRRRDITATLDALYSSDVRVVHDRRTPGKRSTIDHVTVTRSGVHVVHTAPAKGRVELRHREGSHIDRLFIGGRDRSRLVRAVVDRRDAVGRLVRAAHPRVPVTPILCLLDRDEGAAARPFRTNGVTVTWPNDLPKLLTVEGPLDPGQIDDITSMLDQRLRTV